MQMLDFLERLNSETEVLLVLSIILFSGFIMTRLTNTLNLPKVSGYILAGILIGPYGLNFIPAHMIESMGFISDLALAFIAFGVGKFFKKEILMRTGKKIIIITISEALAAGALVTLTLKILFGLDWEFSLILGAIATATAPASTMMTINQYKAKGEFVNTLLQIVALDDVVCLFAFSIVTAVINGRTSGNLTVHAVITPMIFNVAVIGVGAFCGYFLSRLLIPARSRDNRLILVIAMLLGLSGICAAVDISPLLSCMVFGAIYINLTKDKKLFRQINNFTPPVMSIFFIVSGMNLDIMALGTAGAIGICYFVIRIIGKYLGTYVSCMILGTEKEIKKYMGLALIPQAGVAIGLAFLGQRMLPPETGNLMLTIILSSSVLYEMVGPISAKAALFLSGSISYDKNIRDLAEPEKTEWAAKLPDADTEFSEESLSEESLSEESPSEESLSEESPSEKSPSEESLSEKNPSEENLSKEGLSEGDLSEIPGRDDAEFYTECCLPFEPDLAEEIQDADTCAAGLPELKEYNEGVDERDDYDVEHEVKQPKKKKKKNKR